MNTPSRPRVVVDPHFRTMDEIFEAGDRRRLDAFADVEWGRDGPMPTTSLDDVIADVDAVVFGGWRHGRRRLERAPRLRAVLEVAGGHEHDLDYSALLARGVHVGSCAPAFAQVVAEHSLALALDLVRGVSRADRAMRVNDESWLHVGNRGNRSFFGATAGFIGCGGVSVELHELLRPFRVRVVGYDPPLGEARLRQRRIDPVSLERLIAMSDVIFVLAAPTAATHGLVSRQLLSQLRPEQALVITSRASVVDFEALRELAVDGRLRVATDVFPVEPSPPHDPLRSADGVTMTPHLAGALPAALHDIGRRVVDDLEAIFDGRAPHQMQYLDHTNTSGLLQT